VRSAVIQTGGKQYRIAVGETLRVEKLPGEIGEGIEFDKVLMIKDQNRLYWGNPYLEGSKVRAKIIEQGRGKKIIVFKHKRRKGYRKKQGHRQYYTRVKIEGIELGTPGDQEEGIVQEALKTGLMEGEVSKDGA